MNPRRSALVGITVAALSLVAFPATAQNLRVDDPAGDAAGKGLDITSATVRNLDKRIVVKVHFVKSVRGDLIVSLDPRRASGLRLVSEYRPVGHMKNLVVAGAFTDKSVKGEPKTIDCKGFRVKWSPDEPMARLRMPSKCLNGGDYGAVRFTVLTERGADTDAAPDKAKASRWIPRG